MQCLMKMLLTQQHEWKNDFGIVSHKVKKSEKYFHVKYSMKKFVLISSPNSETGKTQ